MSPSEISEILKHMGNVAILVVLWMVKSNVNAFSRKLDKLESKSSDHSRTDAATMKLYRARCPS